MVQAMLELDIDVNIQNKVCTSPPVLAPIPCPT
jgi:hypothetical protein